MWIRELADIAFVGVQADTTWCDTLDEALRGLQTVAPKEAKALATRVLSQIASGEGFAVARTRFIAAAILGGATGRQTFREELGRLPHAAEGYPDELLLAAADAASSGLSGPADLAREVVSEAQRMSREGLLSERTVAELVRRLAPLVLEPGPEREN